MSDCTMTEAQVQEAFLAAPPLIAQTILDLTVQHPNWARDLYEVETWPSGNGTIMEQLVFRGAMPSIERGFAQWKKLNNGTNYGCEPCEGPDCSYNWTTFGGHGFDRKITELMERQFRSPSYCIKEIQTTASFKEVFAKIIENLYRQVDFFKEMNIGLNFLTMLSKKFVVDSGGAKPNTQNPYVYRNIGNARLSMLNIGMLEFFYEWLRRLPDCIPYAVIDGSPIYALCCSHQLLSHVYRDDPTMRNDVRFSGLANDLVTKYNFTSTLRGMFLPAPILYPRRFNIVAGAPQEVLPFVNGIPAEVGTYTGFNPAYESATHEEVTLHGKHPFKVFTFPTEQTLGANSSFGPEAQMFETWQWINPQTIQDPFRRKGYYATAASLGLSQQYSDGIIGILVERPSIKSMAMFFAETACPPEANVCDNEVPDVSCPCPLILGVVPNPITPNTYFASFAVPVAVSGGDTIQLGLDTGGYVTGTVVSVSADGFSIEFTLPANTPATLCTHFTTVFCDDTLGCSADVLSVSCCRTGATGYVDLILKQPIKAVTPGDIIVAYMGDGTTQNLSVVAVDMLHNIWTVEYAAGYGPTDDPAGEGGTNLEEDLCCDRQGVLVVCVPPSTDATCPACGGPTVTQCQS